MRRIQCVQKRYKIDAKINLVGSIRNLNKVINDFHLTNWSEEMRIDTLTFAALTNNAIEHRSAPLTECWLMISGFREIRFSLVKLLMIIKGCKSIQLVFSMKLRKYLHYRDYWKR